MLEVLTAEVRMAKGRILVEEALCKGCELCTTVCPKDVIHMATDRFTPKGYHPASAGRSGRRLHRVRHLQRRSARRSAITVYRWVPAGPGRRAGGLSRGLRGRKSSWKATSAFAEAAIRAGCEAYFGYPITPQTEALEHMARRMPELGRVFVQAESEVAAINMVYGAACAGARVMTSSSSPGISLMKEGISYIAGSEVPVVLVDIMRGGPGLGNIAPSQGDYFQIVKGGGHGDYRPIVLAPATVQELIDLTVLAFDLAEKYRWIVDRPGRRQPRPDDGAGRAAADAARCDRSAERPAWALTGAEGRKPNVISLDLHRPGAWKRRSTAS